MHRFLVAFERPCTEVTSQPESLEVEEAWDRWVDQLTARGLALPTDLDPVASFGNITVYEAVSA